MGRKLHLSLFCIVLFSATAIAQTGEIRGRIIEKGTSEGVPFASVAAFLNGAQVQATVSSLEGDYVIKPLTPGKYEVKATCVGYSISQVSEIIVTADKFTRIDVELPKGVELPVFTVYANPL